jgi:hypothetical protein
MSDTSTHDIHLELSDPRELFQPPELDPLGGQPHAEPGIERILNRIRPRPDRPVRATLRLPAQFSGYSCPLQPERMTYEFG